MSDEFTPNNSDTTVETLSGASDLGEADDAVHFRNNLFASLSLPKKHSDLTRVSLPARTSRPDWTAASGKPKEWRNAKGQLHRDDGPAMTYTNGSQFWYREGKCHRDDGPARIYADGSQAWWRHGQLHRDDGPAVTRADGSQSWWRDGERQPDPPPTPDKDLPPTSVRPDGTKEWRNAKGQFHRDGGPAITDPSGYESWWREGKCHRDDGPAITFANGGQAWYRDGKCTAAGPDMADANGRPSWYRNGVKISKTAISDPSPPTRVFSDGKRHRDDGPAVTWSNGRQFWYRDGKRQPDPPPPPDKDLPPTRVRLDGSKEWRNAKDQLHRDGGPALTYADGSQIWLRDGLLHCDDGPAVTWADGSQFWYRDGQLHRDGGPAYSGADGGQEWYRDGERQCHVITEAVHE